MPLDKVAVIDAAEGSTRSERGALDLAVWIALSIQRRPSVDLLVRSLA